MNNSVAISKRLDLAALEEPERAGGVIVLLVIAVLLVTHGGAGYQQSKPLLFIGVLALLAVTIWWLGQNRLVLNVRHICILVLTIMLMYPAAALGAFHYQTKSGFTFIIANTLSFLLFTQLLTRYGELGYVLICRLFVLAGIAASVLALIVAFHPIQVGDMQFGRQGYFRLLGTFSTPNRFGEAPGLGVLACLFLFMRTQRKRFRSGIVMMGLLLMTLASGSKGVLLGLATALAVILFFSTLVKKKYFWRAAGALLPVLAFFGYYFFDYFLLATKLNQIQEGRLDVGSGRPVIWAQGSELFEASHPLNQLFGHGTSAFVAQVGIDAHSTYWSLLIEYGLISIAAIFAVLLYVLIVLTTDRFNRSVKVFAGSLVIFCLARGVSMPTVLDSFNFAAFAFWAGMAILTTPPRSLGQTHV